MTRRRKPDGGGTAPPAKAAATFAPALNAGFQATTSRVQEMHGAIAGKTFDTLQHIPGLAVPTRIVQGVHDAITHGVYAAVRHGGGAALALAGQAERVATDPARTPGRREQAARSALNGVFGDALAESGSAMAIRMSLHAAGAPLAVDAAGLQALSPRVAVFIHGLACDESSWTAGNAAAGYGDQLSRDLGIDAVYLRYNTGLAIENNAEQFAALLTQAVTAAPHVREWLLIGHSMGGLVARRAHALADAAGSAWATRTPMIVSIGSPHQGAPLERLGELATSALNVSEVTKPLGRIANARSRGIKDLRHGLKGTPTPGPALRMVFGTLSDQAGSLAAKLFGDGLVMPGSAADDGLAGDVERVELAGLGHMALLNHPRVYEVLHRWMGGAADIKRAPNAAPRG
ncbi:MAG: alpha/beta fold hydrolase [Burkholderiales bacterium]